MTQILKRLEIIKSSIFIEDEEIIELQIIKLEKIDIDDEVKNILKYLENSDFSTAIKLIENYLSKYSGVVEYIDPQIQGLKLELNSLEEKLQNLVIEKTEYLNDIEEFNTQYNIHLGDIIKSILSLKKEILYKKTIKYQKIKDIYEEEIKTFDETTETISELKETISELEEALENIDKDDENYDEIYKAYQELHEELKNLEHELYSQKQKLDDTKEQLEDDKLFNEYEDVKSTYDEFENEYEHIKDTQKDINKLNDDEKIEIKKLYKKAARLCHPDIVSDELKEKAHEIMQALNDAYSKKDITKVKEILLNLETGKSFELSSDSIEDKEILKAKIEEFKKTIQELKNEIEEIKSDDTFITISSLDDWDEYFEDLRRDLEEEKEKLVFESKEILEEKKEVEEWIKNLWDWADKNNISNGKLSRKKENLLATTTIDFTGSKLKNIPKEICNLENVNTFSIWDNDITYLPKEIVNFNQLKKLNLRGNPNLAISPSQKEWIENLREKCSVFTDSVRYIREETLEMFVDKNGSTNLNENFSTFSKKQKKNSLLSSIGESITTGIDTLNSGIQTCRDSLELTRNVLQDAIEQSKLDLINTKKKHVLIYRELGFSEEDISKEVELDLDIVQNILKEQTANSESCISTIKYLSTSKIAKQHNIQVKPHLFDELLELNLLYKDNKSYKLTADGIKLGGDYRCNDKGEEWVVWEENSLNKIIENLKIKLGLSSSEIQTLTTHQNEIYDNVITKINNIFNRTQDEDNIISLSGSAGVGKTFLIIKIIQYLKQNEFAVMVTTPTHKSLSVITNNLNKYKIGDIPTKTLHSFLQLKLEIDERTGSKVFVIDEKNKEQNTTEVLIVDESSMVGNDLYHFIIQSINQDRIKVVLFVGDPYQLPPVNSEKNTVFELKNSYLLEEIIRQKKDSYIINIATKIRDCIISQDFSLKIEEFFQENFKELKIFTNKDDFLNHFFTNDSEHWYSRNQIIADYTNKSVDMYNLIARERYWSDRGVLNPKEIEIDDTVVFQEAVLEGEKVIYQNGSITKVKKVSPEYDNNLELSYWLCEDESGSKFKIINYMSQNKYQFLLETKIKEAKNAKIGYEKKVKWTEYYKLKEKYASIKFNYSSTVHKLQGSTYDTVFIDIRKMQSLYKFSNNTEKEFLYRLLYVAVTRASKNIYILMTNSNYNINKK